MSLIIALLFCLDTSAGLMIYADADGFADGTDISNVFSGIMLASVGGASGLDGKVYAKTDSYASTGSMTFGNNLVDTARWSFEVCTWPNFDNYYALKIDFDVPAKYVAIDAIAQDSPSLGLLEAYNSYGGLIYVGYPFKYNWVNGEIVHVEINRTSYDIAYLVIGGQDTTSFTTPIHLDNLMVEILPEPATMMLFIFGAALIRKKRQ